MIVRTRDRKALEKQLEKENDRITAIEDEIELTRSKIENLEGELSDLEGEQESLEKSISENEARLEALLGKKPPIPARNKVRPKAEVTLKVFNLVS